MEFGGQPLSRFSMTLQGVPILHMFRSFPAYFLCYRTQMLIEMSAAAGYQSSDEAI